VQHGPHLGDRLTGALPFALSASTPLLVHSAFAAAYGLHEGRGALVAPNVTALVEELTGADAAGAPRLPPQRHDALIHAARAYRDDVRAHNVRTLEALAGAVPRAASLEPMALLARPARAGFSVTAPLSEEEAAAASDEECEAKRREKRARVGAKKGLEQDRAHTEAMGLAREAEAPQEREELEAARQASETEAALEREARAATAPRAADASGGGLLSIEGAAAAAAAGRRHILRARGGRNVSFVHIPRTGGSTLFLALAGLQTRLDVGFRDVVHSESERCMDALVPADAAGTFNVLFLREPRAHVLSVYRWHHYAGKALSLDHFAAWLAAFLQPLPPPPARVPQLPPALAHPLNIQTRWLSPRCFAAAPRNPHGALLQPPAAAREAIPRLEAFDFVGLTEAMELSWCLLSHKLGAPLPRWCFDAAALPSDERARCLMDSRMFGNHTARDGHVFTGDRLKPRVAACGATDNDALPLYHRRGSGSVALPATAAALNASILRAVDALTAEDAALFAAGCRRLWGEYAAFQERAARGGGKPLREWALPAACLGAPPPAGQP